MKKKKGFTLIELLVVISIIAMLLAILMPALGKVKKLAQRLVCGTNVKGLGTASFVYANDYRDDFPIAGGKGVAEWAATTEQWFETGLTNRDTVTVSASLYMLVREADVGYKSFLCKGTDETEFQMPDAYAGLDPTQAWDFGPNPQDHQSYSYHLPYKNTSAPNKYYPISGTSNSANAIIADKSPYYDTTMTYEEGSPEQWENSVYSIVMNASDSDWTKQRGNSGSHEREGQNVLFVDGHVEFEKSPDVGTRDDNIYTQASGGSTPEESRRVGKQLKYGIGVNSGVPMSSSDSYLVSDELAQ